MNNTSPQFLMGGGEMGALTRAYDWSGSFIGEPHTWPQSLRTTVAMILSSKFPMFLWWGKELIQFYNDAYRPSLGDNGKHPTALGQRAEDCWPETWSIIKPLIDNVLAGEEATWSENQLIPIYRNGNLEDVYWTFSYSPVINESDQIGGVLVICQETTKAVTTHQKLALSEARFRSIVEQAPMAIGLLSGPEMVIDVGNDKLFEVWGRNSSIIGLPILEALPEIRDQQFAQLLEDVYRSGNPYYGNGALAKLEKNGLLEDVYFDFVCMPLRDVSERIVGITILATDVTRQILAQRALKENEAKMRSDRIAAWMEIEESQMQLLALFEQSPVAIAIIKKEDLTFTMANPFYAEMVGRTPEEIVGKPLLEAVPEIAGQGFDQLINKVMETGVPFRSGEQSVDIVRDGRLQTIYVDLTYQPKKDLKGQINGVLVVATDMTQQVLARQKNLEAESALRGAVELAELGTWQINLHTKSVEFSKRIRDWFNLGENELIDVVRVYELIGRPDRKSARKTIERATAPGNDGVFDMEYTVDTSTGIKERILHAHGKVHYNDKGEAYKVSGTVQDVTRQRKIQLELEHQVQQRTEELQMANKELASSNFELAAINKEFVAINEELSQSNNMLARSNENLQQFAYVASHDLQEPLRKVQSFGDLLTKRYSTQLGDGVDYVKRMQAASKRMSVLIEDLLTFSRLSVRQDTSERVPLNHVIESVIAVLELSIQEAGAQITAAKLPVIIGDISQLEQLFQNLLSNALKFRQPGEAPKIQIMHKLIFMNDLPIPIKPLRHAGAYHRIDIIDNGIGFDGNNADRIFQVFQRLHGKHQYPGTGIGLAICEKVVANHGGAITASSKEGEGATFSVFLPA
ncbi:PAS domain-containing protein [Dyadobacter arcticus]|uniref:histidine kinase n=1 Tax=Dyadobacter arcticus TaxID=1078754 RepID=A0ABX0UJ21_9BACT|nr:PAS domain-containing protein [Dyadobacter arcticus]NIJ52807.1 hypothetical protein [Dyadobacter arcticus]